MGIRKIVWENTDNPETLRVQDMEFRTADGHTKESWRGIVRRHVSGNYFVVTVWTAAGKDETGDRWLRPTIELPPEATIEDAKKVVELMLFFNLDTGAH